MGDAWEAVSICVPVCRLQGDLFGPRVVVCALRGPHHNHTLRLVSLLLASPPQHPLPPWLPQPPRAITHMLGLGATSLQGYGACGVGYRRGNQTVGSLSVYLVTCDRLQTSHKLLLLLSNLDFFCLSGMVCL